MLKFLFYSLSRKSSQIDQKNILNLLEFNSKAQLLDLGCGNGVGTEKIGQKIGAKNIVGVDIVENPEHSRKITFIKSDLNHKLPFPDNYFDVVLGNQIIEHINNTDLFLSEIKRVLKPMGYAIISTENLSSWHNIFALLLGWQPFSLNHNHPFSFLTVPVLPKYGHVRAFSYYGFKDLFERNDFKIEALKPAGYFKLQSFIDPFHCHRITIKVRKKPSSFFSELHSK